MNELKKITLNTKEAVQYIGFNRHILDAYRKAGLIKAVKMGRNYFYPVSELNEFINKNLGKEISKDGVIYE